MQTFLKQAMAQKSDRNISHIHEFISKIEDVPPEEFASMVQSIYEVLRNPEKPTKDYYLDLLVDHYIQSFSQRIFKILVGLSSPLDEYLFNFLISKISSYNKDLETRHRVLILISNIVQQNPAWLSKIINNNILNHFFNILKNEEEVVILGTSALILVELIATLPSVISQCLVDICNCFSRLSTFLYKKKLHNDDHILFLHLNSIVYRLFFRLYAMYPCNFIAFLKMNYGMNGNKENLVVFNEIIEPMLGRIRFHPLLITASKEKECDKSRWFYKEAPDILDECGQFVIDPIEFTQFPELYSESQFCSNFDDENNEAGLLHNSMSDEEEKSGDNFVDGNDDTISPQEDNIFNRLNENVLSQTADISLLNSTNLPLSESNKAKNPEFAEEAILLSKENRHAIVSKFSSISATNKSVVVPVAIHSGVGKLGNNFNSHHQRKNVLKTVCFSPFQPIKEMENGSEFKNLKNKSPISSGPSSQPLEHFHSTDNEEVDMEIMRISYNFDNNKSSTDFSKSNNSFSPLSENETGKDKSCRSQSRKDSKDISPLAKSKLVDDHTFAQELVGNIKNSLKKANSRIRYQSHCLPESDKDCDYICSGDSPSLSAFRLLSKSCPMLYFKSDEHAPIDISNGAQGKKLTGDTTSAGADRQVYQGEHIRNTDLATLAEPSSKTKVNLILNNPNLESKQTNKSVNLKKTCKSVDFTKEARQKWRQFHDQIQTRHYTGSSKQYPLHGSSRKDIFDSSLSMDMHYVPRVDTSHRKYTPHQLLDRVLFLNSEFCHKEQLDRVLLNNSQSCLKDMPANMESRRNSALNTNSTTSSIEHIPLINSCLNMNEEDMRKQIAIMYVQLLFERHQRDSHVIRNRRLYKKAKECIELEEKYAALQEQLKLQEELIEQLQHKLNDKMFDFNQHRKVMKDKITKVEEELDTYKERCQFLQNDKNNLEKRYKDEISTLNCSYRTTEQELNKFLCNFNNNNVDLAKLQSENLELKNQLFIFGEYYNKIRDLYLKNRNVTDLNDKLLIGSLKYEKNDLSRQIAKLTLQLDISRDKCSRLENQFAQEEAKWKGKSEVEEIQLYQDTLKMKDKQIEALKTIVVNYNKHLSNLNGQILSQEMRKSAGVI